MDSNYCPIYQPGLPPGAKCVPCSARIIKHMPLFGTKLPSNNVTGVDRILLGRHVPVWLWALEKCLERYSTDSSQGVLFGVELTLKLWGF